MAPGSVQSDAEVPNGIASLSPSLLRWKAEQPPPWIITRMPATGVAGQRTKRHGEICRAPRENSRNPGLTSGRCSKDTRAMAVASPIVELDYPSPDRLRIRKPFQPIARWAGTVFLLAGVVFGGVVMLTGPGDVMVPVLLAAFAAVFAMGFFLQSGEQVLEIDRTTRRIVFAYRAVGRVWRLGGRSHRFSGQGQLSLRVREISGDGNSSHLYCVRLDEGGASMDLLFAHSEAEGEEIADIISDWLGIAVQKGWQPWQAHG